MLLYTRDGEAKAPNATSEKGKPLHVCDRKCWRCGGLGGAEKWRPTGWTCFRCDGTGKDPIRDRLRLYTADELGRMNVLREKREQKKAAARAEAARLEATRIAAEREEIISEWGGFAARIDGELLFGQNDILESVRDRIMLAAKAPTERQIEVVNGILDRNSAERARLARAQHVGKIKERREFTLTLLYTRSHQTGSFPSLYSHWSLFTDENGCKVACKSAQHSLGLKLESSTGRWEDREYTKGQTIKVKATVTEHAYDKKGEPVTYINRPKAI